MFQLVRKLVHKNTPDFFHYETVGRYGTFDEAHDMMEKFKDLDAHNLLPENRDGWTEEDIYEMENNEYFIIDEKEY